MYNFDLTLRTTPARRHFKSKAGQNNHFLITVLVGLDGVLDESLDISPDFSTSWTPKSRVSSYHRSRQYVLESSLVWITDLVDGYRSSILRLPGLISNEATSRINDTESRASKLHELTKSLDMTPTSSQLLVRAAYTWRNRVVHHSSSSGRLPSELRARLVELSDEFKTDYNGLDIEKYIGNVTGTSAPTFKESASTIAAAQHLVELMDAAVTQRLDLEEYAESLIAHHMRERFENGHRSIFVEYWPNDDVKTASRLRQYLLQNGLSPASDEERKISSDWISNIAQLSARDARERFMVEKAR